jgi:hypothetical protein
MIITDPLSDGVEFVTCKDVADTNLSAIMNIVQIEIRVIR